MPTVRPPADWYPHPSEPGKERWWDGEDWTDHVRVQGPAPKEKGRPRVGRVLAWLIPTLMLSALVVFLATAFMTARHWTKEDVSAVERQSSRIELSVGFRPDQACSLGDAWSDCLKRHNGQYNEWCLPDVMRDEDMDFCSSFKSGLKTLEARKFGADAVISEVRWTETDDGTRAANGYSVEHGENRPAETHSAVCYLGFLGECE